MDQYRGGLITGGLKVLKLGDGCLGCKVRFLWRDTCEFDQLTSKAARKINAQWHIANYSVCIYDNGMVILQMAILFCARLLKLSFSVARHLLTYLPTYLFSSENLQ